MLRIALSLFSVVCMVSTIIFSVGSTEGVQKGGGGRTVVCGYNYMYYKISKLKCVKLY